MVTVIADKEELSTPVNNNGVTIDSNENERTFQFIKDYREVDFHRTSSCRPLPEDLINGAMEKSSIQGTFFVQVDLIELLNEVSNNQNQSIHDNTSLILTLTDGIITVRGIINDSICDLNSNVKPGCKLLLTGVIPIQNGFLQLTHDNTRFKHGSNTFPRPRSAHRGRVGGSYRPSNEGRRGGNSNSRQDNDDNGSNFLKRPPPKTLMDFMTLKISDDLKVSIDNENQRLKDRSEIKRRNPEQQYYSSNKMNNGHHNTTNHFYSSNKSTDQLTSQQDGMNEYLDPEDDSSQSNYRERRNPLPPRLQRAQEERTRRNNGRYYDESVTLTGNDLNGNSRNGKTNNPSVSSSQHGDLTSYIPNTPLQHTATLNSYPLHPNMIATVNGSTPTHLPFYHTNLANPAYSLCGIPTSPFHNQSSSLAPSYPVDHLSFCYGIPHATPIYLPPPMVHNFIDESKQPNNNNNNYNYTTTASTIPGNSSMNSTEVEVTNESPVDENNESENKSQSSSSSSSNDVNNNSQQILIEQQSDDKHQDSNSNPRPRWKVGDICLARWSEDHQFYVATIIQIHPPSCTILFRDYNNYDQVHFSDLKVLPRDQHYYQFIPSFGTTSSDLNALTANMYFPQRPNYYTPTMDGCIIMPEAPPFPFNSAGTLYICPSTVTSVSRANRSTSFQQTTHRNDNENSDSNIDTTINSSSTTSKDSNDTSINDSTTISLEDNQTTNHSYSNTDAHVSLVTNDDDHSNPQEIVTSRKLDEQSLATEDGNQDKNAV